MIVPSHNKSVYPAITGPKMGSMGAVRNKTPGGKTQKSKLGVNGPR